MACFLVPTTEAVIVTAVSKIAEAKKKEHEGLEQEAVHASVEEDVKIPFKRKVKWLTNLLYGGSALLAFEHVWHGEVVPWFPFLTAAADAEERAVMLQEMSTVGVTMALLVTGVWVGMLVVSNAIEQKVMKSKAEEEELV